MSKLLASETVLASASPRRLALLRELGVEPQVLVSAVAEIEVGQPQELVAANALAKAQAVAALMPPGKFVIAADTIVFRDGQVLGKPRDAAEARQMLAFLSGATHEVATAITVIDTASGRVCSQTDVTQVTFRTLSAQEIAAYVAGGEPLDKAGAYGIQGQGSVFIERIVGDYGTVVGMSACVLARLLAQLGKAFF